MANFVSAADVSDFTGRDFTPEQRDRVTQHIAWAERYVARRAGFVFYDANDTTGDRSRDWIEVVCRVVERAYLQDDPETREHLANPYSSEREGDYSYTISAEKMKSLRDDPVIEEMIQFWTDNLPIPTIVPVMVVTGPTREGLRNDDIHPDSWYWYTPVGDVSRGAEEGSEQP